MIYLDNGATSFHKPPEVYRAVLQAMQTCANPGRGGYPEAMRAAQRVYDCREQAAALFHCGPEQVAFTASCTQGLNIAIDTLVKPGSRVLISGFEHNGVTRPLYARNAQIVVAGRKLFDWEDTLTQFERELKRGVSAAVFTHCSNVFGYILPVEALAALCKRYGVPFVIDGAQSAGILPIDMEKLGADFIAMPGHKGLLGPQGTGILLCGRKPKPLIQGGTGSHSRLWQMPEEMPDALEAGTVNVPGIAGLGAGIRWLRRRGLYTVFEKEKKAAAICAEGLKAMGYRVYSGPHQSGTVSFTGQEDPEQLAEKLSRKGVCVRGGLHCAPLAHESAGSEGTVRVSFGHDATPGQAQQFLQIMRSL